MHSVQLLYVSRYVADLARATVRAAPIMLLILPIILLRISSKFTSYSKIIPNFYLLFLNYFLKQLQYPT